jgi:hypothetical protein
MMTTPYSFQGFLNHQPVMKGTNMRIKLDKPTGEGWVDVLFPHLPGEGC